MKYKKAFVGLLTTVFFAATGMAAAGDDYPQHGRISFDTGGLMVKGAQDAEWAEAVVNALVVPGDTLWVDEEGTAELEMAGANFLRLADRSKAEIVSLPPDMFIRGWIGSFYVHRFARSEGSLIFSTPAATVDITTDSMVRLDIAANGALTVSVRWGSAAVHTDLGGDVTATEATRVWVDPGYLPSEATPFDRSAGDAFDNWNSERARVLAQSTQTTPKEVVVQSTTVGIYDLPRYGEWIYVDHRPYWRPTVIVDYSPYRDGYWNYVPGVGHVWVDEYPFAYVTSHYGRWRHVPAYGWCWSYDPVWSPAWVASMRVGDYFMWAPIDYYQRPVLVSGAATFMLGGLTFSWMGTCYSQADYLYWGPGYYRGPEREWVDHIHGFGPRDISVWDIAPGYRHRPDIPFAPEFRDRVRDYNPPRSIRGIMAEGGRDFDPMQRAGRLESMLGRGAFEAPRPDMPNPARTAVLGAGPGQGLRQVRLSRTEQVYRALPQGGAAPEARRVSLVPESQRLQRMQPLSGPGGEGPGTTALRGGAPASMTTRSGQGLGATGAPINRMPPTTSVRSGVPRSDMAVRDLESSAPAPPGSGQFQRTPARQGVRTLSNVTSGPAPDAQGAQSMPGIRRAPTTTMQQNTTPPPMSTRSLSNTETRRSGSSSALRSTLPPTIRQQGNSENSLRSMPAPVIRRQGPSENTLRSMPAPTIRNQSGDSGPSLRSMPAPVIRNQSSGGDSSLRSMPAPVIRNQSSGGSSLRSLSGPSPSRSISNMPSMRSSGSAPRMPSISAPSRSGGSGPSIRGGDLPSSGSRRGR